mmetsp:Transcript_17951/g.50595  ORF Transcript_17951/g.50595 Transcript_17951/m.50595 type:complete len:122 (+) Transcript_17951:860-1225(+)
MSDTSDRNKISCILHMGFKGRAVSLINTNFGGGCSDRDALRACKSNWYMGDTKSIHHFDATVGTSVMSKLVSQGWLAHLSYLTQCAYETCEPGGAADKNAFQMSGCGKVSRKMNNKYSLPG